MVLSGTGSDGTIGVEDIKAGGGIVLAQDEASAKYPSMPQCARPKRLRPHGPVAPGARPALERIGNNPLVTLDRDVPAGVDPADGGHFRQVLEILHASAGVNFSAYRESMIRRRVMRRVVLNKAESLGGYVELLMREPSEVEAPLPRPPHQCHQLLPRPGDL